MLHGTNDAVGYNRFTDFDWSGLKDAVQQSSMTDQHVGAVETAMLVEDHIPGYASEYMRLFMVHEGQTDAEDGASVGPGWKRSAVTPRDTMATLGGRSRRFPARDLA